MKANLLIWAWQISWLFLQLEASPHSPIKLPQRPFLFFHGLSGSCTQDIYIEFAAQINAECVETGAVIHSLSPFTKMAQTGCQKIRQLIAKDPKRFENGFHLAGISHGAIIIRQLLLICPEIRHKIRRIFLMGGYNLGLYLSKATRMKTRWKGLVVDNLKFAAGLVYNRITGKYDGVIDSFDNVDEAKNHVYIKALAATETAKKSWDLPNLELLLNLSFSNEDKVPIESSLFGASYDPKRHVVQPYSETHSYRIGYLGLNKLYDEGRMMNCVIRGLHFEVDDPEQVKTIAILTRDDCIFDPRMFEDTPLPKLYRLCLQMKVLHDPKLRKVPCDPTGSRLYHQLGAKLRVKGLVLRSFSPHRI